MINIDTIQPEFGRYIDGSDDERRRNVVLIGSEIADKLFNKRDVTGREVQQLVSGIYNAGEYEVDFMGKYSSSGVYFYKIEISDDSSREKFTETKRMILLK
jgi:hypothetical protein